MSVDLFASAEWLASASNPGYRASSIPDGRDNQITELLRAWMALDEPVRKLAAEGILGKQRMTLLAYSERMASWAVRERNEELITLGLIALGIDGWRGDWRDNLVVVPSHYDAAQRLNADTEKLFEDAATWLSEKPANALRSFLRRPEDKKSLASMGYVAASDESGFRYRRTW